MKNPKIGHTLALPCINHASLTRRCAWHRSTSCISRHYCSVRLATAIILFLSLMDLTQLPPSTTTPEEVADYLREVLNIPDRFCQAFIGELGSSASDYMTAATFFIR